MSNITYVTNAEFKAKGRSDKTVKAAIRKDSSFTPKPLEGRQVKFILSAPAVDRDHDVIDPAGIDLTAFKANPVVLWQHNHDLPIGKCVNIGIEDRALVGVVEFFDASVPEFGQRAEGIYQLCKSGGLNAVSIGFLTEEWAWADDADRRAMGGTDVLRCDMLEFSVVTVPCLRSALIQEIAPEQDAEQAPEPETEKAAPEAASKAAQRRRRIERFVAATR